jgi:hypothetical protein
VHLSGDAGVVTTEGAEVLARAADRPTVVASGQHAWWQPPELADPGNPLLPRSQYGSVASAAAVARWWASVPAAVTIAPVDFHTPVVVQWWQCGEERTFLAGNLETGWIGDARVPRSVVVEVRETLGAITRHELDVPREGCIVERVPSATGTAVAEAP